MLDRTQNFVERPDFPVDELPRASERARVAAVLLKALSHESRLLILYILNYGERTVGELEEMLGLQQAIVSQQLARLRLDQLVESRRDGRQIYYRIADPIVSELIGALCKMYNMYGTETETRLAS